MHFYRDPKNRVYIQVYDADLKRNKRLPRVDTKHYDTMTNEQIEAILARLRPLSPAAQWYLHDPIRKHFERWIDYMEVEEKLDEQTIRQHQTYIERYIFEYFSEVVKKKDPADWPQFSARLYTWAKTEGCKEVVKDADGKPKLTVAGKPVFKSVPAPASVIRVMNISYRKFYNWLGQEGIVPPVELKLRNASKDSKGTKLPRTVMPEEVLEWARNCKVEHVRFTGLMGYFFSLRPQETFAAMEKDFDAGKKIANLEWVISMRALDLYDKLVFNVHQQKQNNGKIIPRAKANSKGWVACFNAEAAKMVVEILDSKKDSEVVTKWNNRMLYKEWAAHGIKDIDIKDLRRASLYWLGHYTQIQPLQLMKHARHSNIETTMLYCRRPGEITEPRTGRLKLEG